MNPEELKFTEDHEWIGKDGSLYVVGITDHAQSQLGDVTYIELPEIGTEVHQNEDVAIVESIKAASDVYAPVAGKIAEVNDTLMDEPELINKDPYGDGWFFKLEAVDRSEYNGLMDAAGYQEFLEKQGDL